MTDVYSTVGTRLTGTPQLERADARQVKNHAGGYTFTLSDEDTLRRFLILGTDGGTYYASAKSATKDAAAVVRRMADAGDMALVRQIREVSLGGLAAKQQPTLLALAIACASPNDQLRAAAVAAVPEVCRTFTMLTTFLGYVKNQRGMGRGLRRAVGKFYTDRTPDDVALQMVKYRQRDGYTHRDVLRIAHPAAPSGDHKTLYDWACNRPVTESLPSLVNAYELLAATTNAKDAAKLIKNNRLPWEAVPDALVNEPQVLEALLPSMGATALLRQLPRFARAGMTGGSFGSDTSKIIVDKLTDSEFVKRGRLHPYQVLLARVMYANGGKQVGYGYGYGAAKAKDNTYTPARSIINALEKTYELAFQNVEPAGKRTGLFLDVSGSMGAAYINQSPLTARDASAAMAMITLRSEPYAMVAGFTSGGGGYRSHEMTRLDITAGDSLTSAINKVSGLPFGGTDCAAPMLWALDNEPTIETFVVYTDNETWAGSMHPHEALRKYRIKTGIDAKLIVVGMTATNFTIADPHDRGMLDVVGFSSDAPRIMAEFSAGRL